MPENPDQKMQRLPRNTEHFEALQEEVNEERRKLIEKLPKKIQKNFQVMDNCTKALEKANVPFFFLANPFGYNFGEYPKGYWRYHKLHGRGKPFSPEAEEDTRLATGHIIHFLLGFSSVIMPSSTIRVVDEDDNIILEYQKGARTK
jgi:hypothetical protein